MKARKLWCEYRKFTVLNVFYFFVGIKTDVYFIASVFIEKMSLSFASIKSFHSA
jgi:hypothetical protein